MPYKSKAATDNTPRKSKTTANCVRRKGHAPARAVERKHYGGMGAMLNTLIEMCDARCHRHSATEHFYFHSICSSPGVIRHQGQRVRHRIRAVICTLRRLVSIRSMDARRDACMVGLQCWSQQRNKQ